MKMADILFQALDHNPRHSTQCRGHRVCSRCFTTYLAGFISLPIFWLLSLFIHLDGRFVFIFSWILGGLCIVDWGSVKAGLRQGSEKARLFSGACLGIAMPFYFFFLPVPLLTRVVGLLFYSLVFSMIVIFVDCREQNINPIDEIRKSIVKPVTEQTKGKMWLELPCCLGCECCGITGWMILIPIIGCCACCCGGLFCICRGCPR